MFSVNRTEFTCCILYLFIFSIHLSYFLFRDLPKEQELTINYTEKLNVGKKLYENFNNVTM